LLVDSEMLPEFLQRNRLGQRRIQARLNSARGGTSGLCMLDLRCLELPNQAKKNVAEASLLATAGHRRRCDKPYFSQAASRYKQLLAMYLAWQTSICQRIE
jgi:hypothetical protein